MPFREDLATLPELTQECISSPLGAVSHVAHNLERARGRDLRSVTERLEVNLISVETLHNCLVHEAKQVPHTI